MIEKESQIIHKEHRANQNEHGKEDSNILMLKIYKGNNCTSKKQVPSSSDMKSSVIQTIIDGKQQSNTDRTSELNMISDGNQWENLVAISHQLMVKIDTKEGFTQVQRAKKIKINKKNTNMAHTRKSLYKRRVYWSEKSKEDKINKNNT